ncbi:MAG TPA: phosphoserine phosphatase SerB [Thermohalobaculum sp.]|nr:phosphoserine phosphatase SerB [Thermohalobaculum sp.]
MSWVLVATAPSGAALDDAAAARIGRAAGGAPVRLGPEAVEVALEAAPDLAALSADFAGIDLNAVPAEGRRKRLLIADMDSTIIPVECIDLVAEYAGRGEEVRGITERAMRGELDFAEAVRARVALAQGLEETALERILAERVTLNPGARTLVRTMAANGAHTALVSGGFAWFCERVAAAAGFAEHRANRLVFEGGRLRGVAEPVLGREAKVEALDEMLARFGLAAAEALAVGDGANDLGMIGAAGLGVGYRPKPVVAELADAVIEHSDLTALLYLQGYSSAAFVTD